MGFAKPIEQYLFGNLLTKMHVFMYLKDIIRVSVHNAMKRLEEFGYVTFHQGKITLTKCGIEKVKNIKQKHQTIASALKLIGASNDIAEENACRMEHVITDEAADLLKLYVEQRTAEQENTIAIKV